MKKNQQLMEILKKILDKSKQAQFLQLLGKFKHLNADMVPVFDKLASLLGLTKGMTVEQAQKK